jgi:hypothetical protein
MGVKCLQHHVLRWNALHVGTRRLGTTPCTPSGLGTHALQACLQQHPAALQAAPTWKEALLTSWAVCCCVFPLQAGHNPMYTFRETIDLGPTHKSMQEIRSIIQQLKQEWPGKKDGATAG